MSRVPAQPSTGANRRVVIIPRLAKWSLAASFFSLVFLALAALLDASTNWNAFGIGLSTVVWFALWLLSLFFAVASHGREIRHDPDRRQWPLVADVVVFASAILGLCFMTALTLEVLYYLSFFE
jgi:uncharacterized membrane protein YhaH (DUF805 family)